MHSLSEFGANVPAFLAKLWKLVDDPDTNDLISWSKEGTSFIIRDQAQFSRKLLPMYYKHNNMASFIRQLNMYGFHKIVSADAGSLRLDKDEMEFAHQCFLRGHPYLLEHIKRKVGKSQFLSNKILEDGREGSNGGVLVKAEFMNKVLTEVKNMRGRQDTVESRLASMKQENEALWRELSLLRQKHIKQQNIVNKLIQFLVTLVQPSQRLSPKRRYPLMINNIAHPSEKTNGKVSNINLNLSEGQLIVLPAPQNPLTRSACGTIIHELDGDTVLPDSDPDPDLLSNSIPLDVSGSQLTEVIDSDLEPEVLSVGEDVLDSLNSANISSVPLLTHATPALSPLEVNSSEQAALEAEALNMDSPSPEALLTVCPSELNPAIVVPALQSRKVEQTEETPLTRATGAASKMATRSTVSSTLGSTLNVKSSGSRKKGSSVSKVVTAAVQPTRSGVGCESKVATGTSVAGDANKGLTTSVKGPQPSKAVSSSSSKNVPSSSAKLNSKTHSTEAPVSSYPVAEVKKELRVLPPRNRRKKQSNSKDTSTTTVSEVLDQVEPLDLLTEVGLASPDQDPLAVDVSNDGAMMNGTALSCPSPLVAFPTSESPIPVIHSPAASPSTPSYSTAGSSMPSPLSAMSASDVTSPLVIFPMSEPGGTQELPSSQQSPIDYGQATHVSDMTLACTSQAGPSALNTPALKQTLDREELDHHVGVLDNELSQLKEFLHTSGLQFDANTLLGLFSADDPTSYSMPIADSDPLNHSPKNDATGNELTYYQPDFMDLNDLWNENSRSTPPASPVDVQGDLNTPVMTPAGAGFGPTFPKRRKV